VLTLTQQAFRQARSYIYEQGRALDARLFDFHFADGSAQSVLSELARYQNDDGGFGHGLEPDVRTPASSAVATQQAFDMVRAVGADASEPLVQRAVRYLLDTFDDDRGVWPIVPPQVEDAPHAPWWTYANSAENFGGFLVNPRAALVGHLHSYAALVPSDLLDDLRHTVVTHLDPMPDEMGMFDFFCYLTLAEAENMPAADRARVVAKLKRAAPRSVEMDPSRWDAYVLMPLDVAPAPDALLADAIPSDAIQANLDRLIDTQLADGSWPIPWSWSVIDEDAWAQAEREWKGHLAVAHLCTLRAFDRLSTPR